MGLKNYLMSRKDGNNDRYKMFIGQNIIKQLKDAGAVLALLSNKADGSAPLTGNDSPWVDLSGNNNDCTLFNQSGTINSGWNSESGQYYNTMDGTDDYGGFADTASLDITEAPLAIGVTLKQEGTEGTGFATSKDSGTTGTVQYGAIIRASANTMSMYLEGVSRVTVPYAPGRYTNIIMCWDGSAVTIYKDGTPDITTGSYVGSLTSQGPLEFGRLLTTLYLDADIATVTIYTGSDIQKILDVEAKISAPYLALNP